MTIKAKSVMSTTLGAARTLVSADPHEDFNGVDLWTPPGDITIIGGWISASINFLPNTALIDTGGIYVGAELSIVARRGENGVIIQAYTQLDPIESPTVGEHSSQSDVRDTQRVIFPEGYGIDLDQWHPLYLNISGRVFASQSVEIAGGGGIYFVLR